MKKMNIFKVNGVWQLGRPDNEHEQEDKDILLPQEHVAGGHPQPEILHDSAMLTQIWGNSKIYRESMSSMGLDINTRVSQIKDRLHQLEGNEQHGLYYFIIIIIIIIIYVELILIVS